MYFKVHNRLKLEMKITVSFIWFWSGFWLAVLFYQTFRHGSFCLLIGCGFLRFVKVNFGQGEIHVSISKNWVYFMIMNCHIASWWHEDSIGHIASWWQEDSQWWQLHHIIQGVIALSCNWQGVTLSDGKVLLSQILHYFFYKIVFRVMKIVKLMQK